MRGTRAWPYGTPDGPPVKDFWGLTMYHTQTGSQLQTDQQFPALGSHEKGFKRDANGPHDIDFAAKPPKGQQGNDGSGQELVHGPGDVRPVAALDRPDLATG